MPAWLSPPMLQSPCHYHAVTMLCTESASSQHLPRNSSSNQSAPTRPATLSDVDLSPVDIMTVPPGTIDTETQGQTVGPVTSRLSRERRNRLVSRPDVQGDQHVKVNFEPFSNQRDAVSRSPVTRLSPEVLAHIFELCLVEEEWMPAFPSARGPFCLAQVCRLWRATAESDPHLWTSIHFYFPNTSPSRKEDVLWMKHVFDLQLKRSGPLPMTLTFTDHRSYHTASEDLVSLLVDRMRAHSCRWKRISLHLPCGYFPRLFTFTPCDLSCLEHLHISGDVLGQRFVTTLHLNLESAKKLKSFAYSGPGHPLVDNVDLHWEQLVEVAFEYAPHNGTSSTLFRQFGRLAQCQNVTTCSLGIDRPFWLDLSGDQTITLPNLRTLRVRRLSPKSHARTVIDALILPGLETLEIDAAILVCSGDQSPAWHDRNFSNLLARSECTLLRLSIQNVDFPNDELMRCLALSPTLISLRFVPLPRSQDITDVIRALDVSRCLFPAHVEQSKHCIVTVGDTIDDKKPPVLVPRLREIALASSIEGYLDLMLAMFRSRGGMHSRVAEVAALRRVEAVFFDLSHSSEDRVGISERRSGAQRVARFQRELGQWVSENEKERKDSTAEGEERAQLKASVVIESPYFAEHINVV